MEQVWSIILCKALQIPPFSDLVTQLPIEGLRHRSPKWALKVWRFKGHGFSCLLFPDEIFSLINLWKINVNNIKCYSFKFLQKYYNNPNTADSKVWYLKKWSHVIQKNMLLVVSLVYPWFLSLTSLLKDAAMAIGSLAAVQGTQQTRAVLGGEAKNSTRPEIKRYKKCQVQVSFIFRYLLI